MSTKPQIELFLENESGTQQVAYPFVESDHVSLSNGMDIDTMIRQDVSMPTVAHEDLSFKVGVGDQDVSSAIVDSSVAEMTIKGKTYQNILPEPSTHVLTNNKEMFKVNEGLDPNVEIVDGVSKSAILKGNTLINLLENKYSFVNLPTNAEVELNSAVNTYDAPDVRVKRIKLNQTLQANKKYILLLNVVSLENGKSIGGLTVSTSNEEDYNIPRFSNTGLQYKMFETKFEVKEICLYLDFNETTPSIAKIKQPVLIEYQEGMENWDIPYFEGMKSVQMPVLCTIGKNLFNSNNTMDGYGFSVGEVIVKDTWFISDYIEVKPNLSYIISASDNSVVGRRVNFYDKDKNFVETGRYENLIITVPNNNKIFYMRTNADLSIKSSYQIEQGTVATSYEPYKTNILHTTNLLSNTTLTQGCINTDGSLTTSGESASYSVFTEIIPVKPNTEYYIATDNADITYDRIAYYNSSKTFMRRSDTLYASKSTSLTIPNDTYYIRIAFYQGSGIQITPQQLGNAVCQEMVVLRSLPNGVKDTLNLMTGEYVQRIGEITVCPTSVSQIEILSQDYTNTIMARIKSIPSIVIKSKTDEKQHLCDKYPYEFINDDYEHVYFNVESNPTFAIFLKRSKLSSQDANGVFQYLSNNPIIIQSELATPVVKTVDLSSSGNWEKVVLNGSETGWSNSYSEWANKVFCLNNRYLPNVIKPTSIYGTYVMCDKLRGYTIQWLCAELGRTGVALHSWGGGYLQIAINGVNTVDELKQYLSQNPVTVWYQTATTLDSTQVKQPIFFKDGHIQLSSGVDNSLIPTLDYQAKTSNSYVMDLMKTNTKYTMKAKTASGTFTIDGTSYGTGTNGTFTTPTSMTNKFLVMSNKTNEEVMILEGDLTSKDIPYFKGIKSAFEDESKIEVLSTGKNLFDMNRRYDKITNAQATVVQNVDEITISSVESGTYVNANFVLDKNFFKGKTVVGSCLYESDEKGIGTVQINYQDTTGKKYYQSIKTPRTFTFPDEFVGDVLLCIYANNTNTPQSNTVTVKNIQLELGTKSTTYDSHKSNVSKIPLLWNKPSTHKHSPQMEFGELDRNTGDNYNGNGNSNLRSVNHLELKDKLIAISFYNDDKPRAMNIAYYDADKNFISFSYTDGTAITAFPSNAKYIRFYLGNKNANNLTVVQTYLGEGQLVSLPNNVRDEIILDRENNKAKIVQRVNKIILDGSENGWFKTTYVSGEVVEFAIPCTNVNGLGLCNNMMIYGDTERIVYASDKIYIRILKTKANNIETFRNHLQSNPTIVYCELATPIITEVDLEGFPYIYKDGHIFLNGEIAPVTEIKYSINQQHQIEASNQDIIRHQKEIDYLYKLIGEYVRVDYKNTLLSLNLELK